MAAPASPAPAPLPPVPQAPPMPLQDMDAGSIMPPPDDLPVPDDMEIPGGSLVPNSNAPPAPLGPDAPVPQAPGGGGLPPLPLADMDAPQPPGNASEDVIAFDELFEKFC